MSAPVATSAGRQRRFQQLKLAVLDGSDDVVVATTVQQWDGDRHLAPLAEFLAAVGRVDAVGHRVVHGGPRYTGPVVVGELVVSYLWSIGHLAQLHDPLALAGIAAAGALPPGVPAVACFDTTFHVTLPPAAATYAVPRDWNQRWGLRLAGRGAERDLGGHHDGVHAAGRAGHEHPAGHAGPRAAALVAGARARTTGGTADVLEHHAGLKGLSGTSGDLREVLAGRDDGDADCALAADVYLHRLTREIAAMTASTGGLDLLVMTGGVGEHAAPVREAVGAALGHLGLAVDPARNDAVDGDADVTAEGAAARTVVVTSREDLEIQRQVRRLLDG